jgi:hypothetical protein
MSIWMAALALAAADPAPAPAPAATETLRLGPKTNYVIAAAVNGQPVRLRVDPGAGGSVILNPGAAARLGLDGSLIAPSAAIGPVRLRGDSSVARLSVAGVEWRRRLLWFDRDVVPQEEADGLIGPAELPYPAVRFDIAAPQPGERVVELPLAFGPWRGAHNVVRVGERDIEVTFSLRHPVSRASAAAGALLAEHFGGGWDGEMREIEILFGVQRPARPFRLARPLPLGGLDLDRPMVRTADWRGRYELPADIASADADEIVVTADRRGRRQRATFLVTVGTDILSRCSAILFEKAAARFVMYCRPAIAEAQPAP